MNIRGRRTTFIGLGEPATGIYALLGYRVCVRQRRTLQYQLLPYSAVVCNYLILRESLSHLYTCIFFIISQDVAICPNTFSNSIDSYC